MFHLSLISTMLGRCETFFVDTSEWPTGSVTLCVPRRPYRSPDLYVLRIIRINCVLVRPSCRTSRAMVTTVCPNQALGRSMHTVH